MDTSVPLTMRLFRDHSARIALCFWLLAISMPVQAQGNDPEPHDLVVGHKPILHLRAHPPLSNAGKAEIEHLITQLATIDKPDGGYAAVSSGSGFAPLPDLQETSGAGILGASVTPSPLVRRLVEIGPDAMPFLLAHLSDATPTKLIFQGDDNFGGLVYADELFGNDAIPREKPYLLYGSDLFQRFPDKNNKPAVSEERRYTLKVGDICYSIIGQITGRGYAASRYQPTGITVINSPVRDPALCKAVRAIWTSDNPRQHLFDTWLMDHATQSRKFKAWLSKRGAHMKRPISDSDERDFWSGAGYDWNRSIGYDWNKASRLQCIAATRLLYYFPGESVPLIVRRLDNRNVHAATPVDELNSQKFIEAVSWCKRPEIQATVLRICQRTDDTDVLRATLSGLAESNWSTVHPRLIAVLRKHYKDRTDEDQQYRAWKDERDYFLLNTLYKYDGEKAKPVFEECLHKGNHFQVLLACEVMNKGHIEWDTRLLLPLLSDQKPYGFAQHYTLSIEEGPVEPIRVCDKAAAILCEHQPDLQFEMNSTNVEHDRQIAVIKLKLKNQSPVSAL